MAVIVAMIMIVTMIVGMTIAVMIGGPTGTALRETRDGAISERLGFGSDVGTDRDRPQGERNCRAHVDVIT